MSLRVANAGGDARAQLRDGSTTGTVLATIDVPHTGGWQNWTTVTADLSSSPANSELYLIYTQQRFNLNWIEFIPAGACRQKTTSARWAS